MTVVSGRNRVNRPFFFTEVDGSRAEFPSFGTGTGDLEGNELRKFEAYVAAKQITRIEVEPDVAPENTEAPVLTGTPEVGSVLSCTLGEWTGTPAPELSRQWQSSPDGEEDWEDLEGRTGATFTIGSELENLHLRCVVTATNTAGSASAESNSLGPVTTGE